MKSGLIRWVAFGERDFIRGVAFGERDFIRGVAFGERDFIRGGPLYIIRFYSLFMVFDFK